MEKGREGGAPVTNVATGGASSNTTTNTTAATSFISTTKTPEVQVVEQPPKRRAGAPKRKANNSNTSGISSTPKRLAKERPSVPLPPNHNGPCTRARQSPNKLALAAAAAAAAAATSATGKPPGTGQSLVSTSSGEGAAEESNAAKEYWQDLEPLMDAEFEAVRSRDTNAHVVPTHAGWFSWTKIHPLEERSMPLFFNGKSEKRTPDIYLGIRNHIMKKFHADPQTPIELKDLSELSVGEPDARQEVMEFLDYWGLINFHPFPPSDSVMANAEVDAIVNTTTLLEKLYRFDTVQLLSPGPRADLSTPVVPPRLFPETAIVDDLVRPEGPSVEYHCNSCSADCSRKRYHCQKQADFDLCSECYNDGKFDSGMSPSDFILMEPAEAPGVSGGSWTDQETLLLLEALELYGENWNEIAEHVATKTKAQCILHFVQMPIEDIFLEHKENIDTGTQGNTNPDSVNDITSALKDAPEITESKASEEGKCVTNEDSIGAANEESKSTTNEENKSTANEESKSTANEESKSTPNVENKSTDNESKSAAKEEKSLSLVVDASKSKDEGQGKVDSDLDTNHALKALKEAFQAVSPLPECEGSLSFSDAGNPVMALVAFIARLVEPNVAAASTIRLLKTISEDSPAIQLATRNCFLLEDPPADDMKEPHVSESAVVEMVELEAQNKNQNVEEQGEEAHTSNVDGIDPSKDSSVQKIVNAVSKEESCAFPSEDLTEKPCVSKALEDVTTEERVTTNSQDKVSLSTQNEVGPITVKESHEPDNGDGKSDPMKDDLALPAEDPPSSVNKSVDEGAVVEATKCSEVTNAVDKKCESIPSQEKEEKEKKASQPVASNSMVQSRADEKTGDNTKLSDCKSENGRLMETKDQRYVDKVKRAAITAISAAGVKAKLLAKQEEDQIRQLTTFLIEKQVHKLETKLAFFSEMESMIVRVREQMDRSRQRLYQERAQIIAARLGLPASSSRTLPPSYPNNKIPIGYSNSVPKPLPGMNSSKSSVKRTMMPSAPLLSNSSIPSSVTGSLSHPSNQDKTSSVGTS